MTPDYASITEWLKNRPQSQAVKDREAHAKEMLERYHASKRDSSAVPGNRGA